MAQKLLLSVGAEVCMQIVHKYDYFKEKFAVYMIFTK